MCIGIPSYGVRPIHYIIYGYTTYTVRRIPKEECDMSGQRGFRILLAALLLASLPILAGCAKKSVLQPRESSSGGKEAPPDKPKPEDALEGEEKEVIQPTTGKMVRVAIRLAAPSVTGAGYSLGSITQNPEAQAYQDKLRQEQDEMIRRIEERIGHPIQVKQRMTLSTNVISANVYITDIELIRSMKGVISVTEETRHDPTGGATPSPAIPGNTASG